MSSERAGRLGSPACLTVIRWVRGKAMLASISAGVKTSFRRLISRFSSSEAVQQPVPMLLYKRLRNDSRWTLYAPNAAPIQHHRSGGSIRHCLPHTRATEQPARVSAETMRLEGESLIESYKSLGWNFHPNSLGAISVEEQSVDRASGLSSRQDTFSGLLHLKRCR